MGPSGQYGTNSALMVAQALVQRAVGAASTIALAHALGPGLLGAYSIATTTANGAYGLVRLGVDIGAHVLAARDDAGQSPQRLGRILGLTLVVILILAVAGGLACLLLAGLLAPTLFNEPRAAVFVGIAGLLLLGLALTQGAYVSFGGLHRFGGYAAVMMAGAPLLALGIVLSASWHGAVAAAWAAGIGQLLLAGALLVVLWRTAGRLGVAIQPNLDGRILGDVLRIGLPFYAAGLLMLPVDYLAQAALVRLHGLATLGDLRVVMTAAGLVTFLPAAINGPMISALSRVQGAGGDTQAAFSLNLRAVWTIGLGLALGLGLVWPWAVDLLFGPDYDAARRLGVLGIVAAAGLCLRHVMANSLVAFGRQRLLLLVGGLEAVAFTLAALALLPRLGLGGYLVAQVMGTWAPLVAAALWAFAGGARPADNGRFLAAALLSAAGLGSVTAISLLQSGSAWMFAVVAVGVVLLWPWLVFSPRERGGLARIGARFAPR